MSKYLYFIEKKEERDDAGLRNNNNISVYVIYLVIQFVIRLVEILKIV